MLMNEDFGAVEKLGPKLLGEPSKPVFLPCSSLLEKGAGGKRQCFTSWSMLMS